MSSGGKYPKNDLISKLEASSLGEIKAIDIEKLIPVFSQEELKDIITCHELSKEFSCKYTDIILEDFKIHPTWGPILKHTPKEVMDENNRISMALQAEAIYNNNWIPFIENLIQQGIVYAEMGVSFKDWLDLIIIAKKHTNIILDKEYKDDLAKQIAIANGMNLISDVSIYMIGESYLIEERKKTELTTKAYLEEKKYAQYTRSLIDSSVDPFIIVSLEGKITDFNEAFLFITGLKKEQVLDSDFESFFTDVEAASEAYQMVQETGSVKSCPLSIKSPNEGQVDVILNASVFKDESGNVIGVFAAVHDISLQKKIAELEQVKILEQKRKEYTTVLEHKNKQLVDFCNIISHNLRAPLTNISMLVDFIEHTEDQEEKEEVFSKIKPVINHLNEVFNELVESIQIIEDKGIKSELISLEHTFSYVLKSFDFQIDKIGATVSVDFSDAEQVSYPKKYIESIFSNLISNALKYYSPDRQPRIKIESKTTDDGILLIFEDNGLGIDMTKHQDHVFKIRKVFHKHPDAKGFGLFLIKTQIESTGDKIWLESEADKGAKFYIQFFNK